MEAGPAFSTSDFAGLCSGLWHRASLFARVSVVYLLLWHKQSYSALFRLRFFLVLLRFKCIARNSFLIRQLELTVCFYLGVPVFICSPVFLTIPQRLASLVFACVLLCLTFITKSWSKGIAVWKSKVPGMRSYWNQVWTQIAREKDFLAELFSMNWGNPPHPPCMPANS